MDSKATKKFNKFCVVGQKDGAYLAAFVYWQTEQQLIFWLPDPNDYDAQYIVADSYVDVNLRQGLRDKEDPSNRDDEMQSSYAKTIITACNHYGQNFKANKS